MRWDPLVRVCVLFLLAVLPAQTQSVKLDQPAQEIHAQKVETPDDVRARLNNAQLQKDASELSQLCGALSGDLNGLKQGLLQKDLLDRLKRAEKLSRKVREELQR